MKKIKVLFSFFFFFLVFVYVYYYNLIIFLRRLGFCAYCAVIV